MIQGFCFSCFSAFVAELAELIISAFQFLSGLWLMLKLGGFWAWKKKDKQVLVLSECSQTVMVTSDALVGGWILKREDSSGCFHFYPTNHLQMVSLLLLLKLLWKLRISDLLVALLWFSRPKDTKYLCDTVKVLKTTSTCHFNWKLGI